MEKTLKQNIRKNNLICSINDHFQKYKTLYTSLILSLFIIFIWNKYGKIIMEYCFHKKNITSKVKIIDKNTEVADSIQEIHKILSQM
ncbi:hypothetical protein CPAV1605_660 [seawater metagenome]|uniref:Uncharacterized protein n=1 Tax=seawater metagenome TaxID=1561972 RepID=A0A5E8CLJ2_9ZZZZ